MYQGPPLAGQTGLEAPAHRVHPEALRGGPFPGPAGLLMHGLHGLLPGSNQAAGWLRAAHACIQGEIGALQRVLPHGFMRRCCIQTVTQLQYLNPAVLGVSSQCPHSPFICSFKVRDHGFKQGRSACIVCLMIQQDCLQEPSCRDRRVKRMSTWPSFQPCDCGRLPRLVSATHIPCSACTHWMPHLHHWAGDPAAPGTTGASCCCSRGWKLHVALFHPVWVCWGLAGGCGWLHVSLRMP